MTPEADAEREVARLQARVATLQAQNDALARCLQPVLMELVARDLAGTPVPDAAPVLTFMGNGTSDVVTAGALRDALNPHRHAAPRP